MTPERLSELLECPEKHIPLGDYCYDYYNGEIISCPFWDYRDDLPEQENGYCYFLQKSDWDINEEIEKSNKSSFKFDDDDIDEKTGMKTHFPTSLLWDQCKECYLNK